MWEVYEDSVRPRFDYVSWKGLDTKEFHVSYFYCNGEIFMMISRRYRSDEIESVKLSLFLTRKVLYENRYRQRDIENRYRQRDI